MVYCGKPGKACEECRMRRTKCDTKRPSCSQCIRAGRTCKGYRDPGELIFRDESQRLGFNRQRKKESHSAKTAQIRQPGKSVATSLLPSPTDSDQNWALQPRSSSVISVTLGPSAEEQATCFFFQNYVAEDDPLGASGSYQFLIDIYGYEEIGIALADSVSSLGMVGLANFWKAPSIKVKAHAKYNSALRTLASHLRDVEKAKSDQTLIATLLLGLYEINTCKGPESMDIASQHIKGAMALLNFRGKEKLRTTVGYSMFIYLRTQAITTCILRRTEVPPIIREWNKELDFEDVEKAAATRLSEIAMNFCHIRASMSSLDDFSDCERIICEACKVDAQFDTWAMTCPSDYDFQIVTLDERHKEVYSDHYHVYSSPWNGTVWNHYRCMRTLLNEIILHQLHHFRNNNPESKVLCLSESQLVKSKSTILQLCHDLCASVPYFLNFKLDSTPERREMPKAVNGNFLVWPLYTAGCTTIVSPLMRKWVAERLQWIADIMGIRQAAPLAYSAAQQLDLLTWHGETEDFPNNTSYDEMLN